MSSITEILSTDIIKNSREVINTNFSNLNSDKLESTDLTATNTSVSTTNFDKNLSSADDTVQKALETLDELTAWEASFDTATATIDWSTSNNKEITITADTTLTQSNLPNWQTCYLKITDWWNFTITWDDTINWAWATAPTLTENWVDFVVFKKNATTIYADYWNDFNI